MMHVQKKHQIVLKSGHSSYLPAYEDGTEYSETSAYKIHTPGNYPEESIQHSGRGEIWKSRKLELPHLQVKTLFSTRRF